MINIDIEILFYIILFVFPGLIIERIISLFIPQEKLEGERKTLQFISYSIINYVFFAYIFYLISKIKCEEILIIVFLSTIILSSILTGLVISFLKRGEVIRKILERFNIFLSINNRIPTAWQSIFYNIEECYVKIVLKDGNIIRGYLNENSYLSSNEDYKDLYLDNIYTLNKENEWIEVPNRGVWINPSEIISIEIYKNEKEKTNEKRK